MGIVYTTDNNEFIADGVTRNPNYGQTIQSGEPDPAPPPNTPNNPYFGKNPLIPKLFWGLVLQAYIALANGDAGLGLDRLGRLLTSNRAQGIIKIADAVSTLDPDDKDGDFLRMAHLLTTTNHEDGQLIMTPAEFAAIMSAWK